MYSPGSDKLHCTYQPDSRVILAFSDVEKYFLFSDLAVKAAKLKHKKAFQRQRGLGLTAG